jgi:citrate synthase
MSDRKITLTDNATGKSVELPILAPTYGDPVMDIGKLNKEFGLFTYDPGFVSTASCESAITYLDGDKGELMYRGYPLNNWQPKPHF